MLQPKRFAAVVLSVATLLAAKPPVGTALLHTGFKPEKAPFSVRFHDESSSYRVTPLFALPNETVSIEVDHNPQNIKLSFYAVEGELVIQSLDRFEWNAPSTPGLYPIEVKDDLSGESIRIQAFVMVPFDRAQDGDVNGYRIGRYPPELPSRGAVYSMPRGFIEVTQDLKSAHVTPHFRLSQFLCKQTGGYPKYIVLRERLLFKLEYLLEQVNAEGIPAQSFTVMSGYRTPYYNAAIRNVRYSRHLWGDAADIFVDDNGDSYMDDLNGDARSDSRDAEVLFNLVNRLAERPAFSPFLGGLGRYRPTENHGPFVHVDARGVKAKWKN